ncbi:hypothetical protein IJ732_08535 [bacterium]|nr:hypothetical protein [bacterium]
MKKIIAISVLAICFWGTSVNAETVIYNPSSNIFHKITCPHAKRCKSCIKIEKQEAKSNGARACKSCGG